MIAKKKMKKRKKNQGNSFIMVVATISFLAVLVAALLVAVALCYRLKAYDINARDNFYYLEQAMDEIYAGVGGDAMQILNQAYEDTIEVMVYYDTKSKTYVTMDNDEANKLLKATYMKMLQKDSRYETDTKVSARLQGFLSNRYEASSNPEGVQLSIKTIEKNTDDMTIKQLVLKRQAEYSTYNARAKKDSAGGVAGGDTFVQTITTDLVIGKPQFDVKFNSIASDLSDLYGFSMISDMGIEITGKSGNSALGKKVNITGNIYAASDFYNKSYNENAKPDKVPLVSGVATTTVKSEQIQKVHSYSDDQLKKFDGVNMKSMYSGLYIDGAEVILSSDKIIVPGTIAAMNCADVTISNIANSSVDYADIWADGIVLDGYALRQNAEGTKLKGSSLNMRAHAYIYDDLEVNANSANVLLNGQYFGYNYAANDNRVYTEAATAKNVDADTIAKNTAVKSGTRGFTKDTDDGITDGQGILGQAHYNSSAIILNGENTTLDFSLTSALYVAGQSYIEASKNVKEPEEEAKEKITYTVAGEGSITDEVGDKVVSYPNQKEKDGEITDNYTVNSNGTGESAKTPIQDYRTGEAISIKSNQLAYIPNWAVHDEKDGLYLSLPERLRDVDAYKGIWDSFDQIPVIKSVISGKKYYFLDFSNAKKDNAMRQFIADYAALFNKTNPDDEEEISQGEALGLFNITDYDYFQVEMLKVKEDKDTAYANIYTNAAITSKVGDTFTIIANSDNIAPLKAAAENLNDAVKEGNVEGNDSVELPEESEDNAALLLSASVSAKMQDQYKEMKWLLTRTSSNGQFVTEAHNLREDVITPINHYFDFSKIADNKYCPLECGYGVWIANGDVEIGATGYKFGSDDNSYSKSFAGGKVKGIVIAKGEVSFADDVSEFEGLIVTGGKIIVNNFGSQNAMTFMANEEIVKTVLRECDSSRGNTDNYGFVCDIFRLFQSQYVPPASSTDTPVISMRDISAVQFEDILSFRNWKKNVD